MGIQKEKDEEDEGPSKNAYKFAEHMNKGMFIIYQALYPR